MEIVTSKDGDRLLISDFGLWKQTNEEGSHSISVLFGKERWMAPELLIVRSEDGSYRGTGDTDIYSMGCVFFYFLTKGSHPYYENRKNVQLKEADFRRK